MGCSLKQENWNHGLGMPLYWLYKDTCGSATKAATEKELVTQALFGGTESKSQYKG